MTFFTCNKCKRNDILAHEMIWSPLPSWCKECYNQYRSEYMKKYRKTDNGMRKSRNKQFKYKYGITIEQYELMLMNQNNQCLICYREFSDKIKPDVDHDHITKKVRGIICHSCNLGIGYLREDLAVVQRLLNYLKSHTAQTEGDENVATIQ